MNEFIIDDLMCFLMAYMTVELVKSLSAHTRCERKSFVVTSILAVATKNVFGRG